jgi:hypothetical protein
MTEEANILLSTLKKKYESVSSFFNERTRRIWAAAEALAIGKRGPALLAEVTGLAISTIYLGINDIKQGHKSQENSEARERTRKAGGGRKLNRQMRSIGKE